MTDTNGGSSATPTLAPWLAMWLSLPSGFSSGGSSQAMRRTSGSSWSGLLNGCGQSEVVIVGSELSLVVFDLIEQYDYILATPSVSFVEAYQLWAWTWRAGRTAKAEVSSCSPRWGFVGSLCSRVGSSCSWGRC